MPPMGFRDTQANRAGYRLSRARDRFYSDCTAPIDARVSIRLRGGLRLVLFEFYVRGLIALKVACLPVVPSHFDLVVRFDDRA